MENNDSTRIGGSMNNSSLFKHIDGITEMLQHFGDYDQYYPMTKALEEKTFIVPPYIPKEGGFSAARFMGRLVGFNAAAWNDKRTPRMIKEKTGPNDNDIKVVLSAFNEEEENAVEKLAEKFQQSDSTNNIDDAFRLGLWEGAAILVHKEDLSLLYTEIDIDINKGCPKSNIPSYEYSRLSEMSLAAFLNWKKSADEIKTILLKEGSNESDAKNIIEGMLRMVQKSIPKPGLWPIVSILTGLFFILGSFFIIIQHSRRIGSFAIGVGLCFMLGGFRPYIKHMKMKKRIEAALDEIDIYCLLVYFMVCGTSFRPI